MRKRYFIPLLLALITFCGLNSAMAQLVFDNAFLQGQWLEVAIAPNGSWGNTVTVPAGYHNRGGSTFYTDPVTGTTASGLGMDFSYDSGHDGWGVGVVPWYGAYFLPGTPFDGWSMQVNGLMSSAFYSSSGFDNTMGGTLTGTVVSYTNAGGTMTGTWRGTAGVGSALQITQANRLDTLASWLVVTVKFKNTSLSTMPGIYYMVTADPDNDELLSGGSFPTNNHIAYQGDYFNRHEVWGRPPSLHQDAFSGLCAKDCRAQALIYQSWPPSMSAGNKLDLVWAHTATGMGTCNYALGATTYSQDIAYGLVWKVGDLAAGDSAIISYAWIFGDTSAIDSAFPVPSLHTGGVAHDSLDTVVGCNVIGNTFIASVLDGDAKDWSMSHWTWAPSRGLSATTGSTVTVNMTGLGGPTTYTITGTKDTAHGACGTKVFYLYVIPCFSATSNSMGVPDGLGGYYMNSRGDSVICMNETLRLFAHGDSTGATYFWYGPLGYTAFTQYATRTGLTLADTGIYTVVKTVGTVHDTAKVRVFLKVLPVVTATSTTPVCSGTSFSLSALPDSATETFSWTGPNGFTSTLEFPVVTPAWVSTGGIYKVVTSLRGCFDSGTVFAIVDSTPAVPTATSNSPICSQRGLLNLFASDATPGVSYNWTGPLGFTSTMRNPSIGPSVITGASGTYTVVVSLTGLGGLTCYNNNTTVVVVDSTPTRPVLGSNSPICSGTALNMTATTSLTPVLWSWIGPIGYTSILQNPSINPAITANTGLYSVTATYVYPGISCTSDTAVMYNEVDTTPVLPIASSNSPGPPSICQGDTLFLYSSDSTAGVTFTWTGPDLYTTTVQNPFIAPVTPAATGQYTITVTVGSCIGASVITVSITPTPFITATSNRPCSGTWDTLFLQAISVPGASFIWDGPYTFRSNVNNPFRTPAIMEYNGIYHVTAYVNGCSSGIINDTVVVRETPKPPMVPWLTFCQYYDAPRLDAMGDSILWYTSGSSKVGSLVGPIPSTSVPGNSWFFATQTLNGCTSFKDSIQVTVFPKPTVTVSHDTAVCPRDTAVLRAYDSDPVAYYHWAPTMYLDDTSSAITTIRPETNRTYTVVASNQYSCTDTATVTVNVLAAAVIELGDSTMIYPGESYQINTQTNCTSLSWFPPYGLDDPYSSSPVASPDMNTKYLVHGTTGWGCATDDSINIYVSQDALLGVPNAFVPGNGPNGKFMIIRRGIAVLNSFAIYDRWGVKVFETNNISEGWDGKFNSTPQPEGVYVYQIDAVTATGKKFVKVGNVTLIR